MTDEQYSKQIEKARNFARDKARRKKIKSIKNAEKHDKPKKHFEFSKIIVLITFVMCMEILIFSQVLLYKTMDTSALYSLIAIPSTLVPILFSYFGKSRAENLLKISQDITGQCNQQENTETNQMNNEFTGSTTGVG